MDKIKEIVSLCKCGVTAIINEHREFSQTAADWIENHKHLGDAPKDVIEQMIRRDTVIQLIACPTVGIYYDVFHYDLDAALDEMLNRLKSAEKGR